MPGSRKSAFEFGPFRLDTVEHVLSRDGRRLPLTPKVYDVLRLLVEHAGHLVEKEQLLQEVWPDTFVEEGALNRSISVLRKTLGETAADRYIETVPKRGYRFVAAVRPVTAGDAAGVPGRAWPVWGRSVAVAAVLVVHAPEFSAAAIHWRAGTSGGGCPPTGDAERQRRRRDAVGRRPAHRLCVCGGDGEAIDRAASGGRTAGCDLRGAGTRLPALVPRWVPVAVLGAGRRLRRHLRHRATGRRSAIDQAWPVRRVLVAGRADDRGHELSERTDLASRPGGKRTTDV